MLTILGFTFKRFEGEVDIRRLRLKQHGIVVAIDPDTNKVTIHEGILKRVLALYTAIHEVHVVYFYQGGVDLDQKVPFTKNNVQIALLDQLEDRNQQKACLRKITRYRDVFKPEWIWDDYLKLIPDLPERIARTQELLKLERV